jgi:hypothetical protein
MGDRKNFNCESFASMRADKDEIVAVGPLKAEGAPVPGAGFSPEAVPGNSAENEETPARISHFEESMLNVVDKHWNSFENPFERSV